MVHSDIYNFSFNTVGYLWQMGLPFSSIGRVMNSIQIVLIFGCQRTWVQTTAEAILVSVTHVAVDIVKGEFDLNHCVESGMTCTCISIPDLNNVSCFSAPALKLNQASLISPFRLWKRTKVFYYSSLIGPFQ